MLITNNYFTATPLFSSTREAYSHEVISHGFRPGGNGQQAAFYAGPAARLREFLASTCAAGATLAGWNRPALER